MYDVFEIVLKEPTQKPFTYSWTHCVIISIIATGTYLVLVTGIRSGARACLQARFRALTDLQCDVNASGTNYKVQVS
jgi:hypothetical protein